MVDFSKLPKLSDPVYQAQRTAEEAARWYNQRLVVFDFETTGLDAAVNRVIEIGVAVFEDATLKHSISRFVHPGFDPRMIDFKLIKLTHIDPRDLMAAPPFWQVYNELAPFWSEPGLVVAYNAPFDRRFFLHEVARSWPRKAFHTLPHPLEPDALWIDPHAMAREVFDLWSFRLRDVARECGVAGRAGHEARLDAITAGEIAIVLGRAHRNFQKLDGVIAARTGAAAFVPMQRRKVEPKKGIHSVYVCDVCHQAEVTEDGKPPQGWAHYDRTLTTCGAACDIVAGWWSQRW